MKIILPWLLFLIAAAGAAVFYNGNQTKTAELQKLQIQAQEAETLRTEMEELQKNQVSPEELARLKEGRDELLRLRNQVRQLTADKSQLSEQAQAAQSAAAQAQAQAQTLAQAQNQVLAQAQEQVQLAASSTCINQLRQLDSSKHQWALEHQKAAEATPAENDLLPYLPNQALPVCPGGGKYTLGSVAAPVTCSVTNHVLPPPPQ
jgi:hypothetical protein